MLPMHWTKKFLGSPFIWKTREELIQATLQTDRAVSRPDTVQVTFWIELLWREVIPLKILSNQQLPDPKVENVEGTVKPRQQLPKWLDPVVRKEAGHRLPETPPFPPWSVMILRCLLAAIVLRLGVILDRTKRLRIQSPKRTGKDDRHRRNKELTLSDGGRTNGLTASTQISDSIQSSAVWREPMPSSRMIRI